MGLKTPPAFAICSSNVLNLFAIPAQPSITSPSRDPCRRATSSLRCYTTVHHPSNDPPRNLPGKKCTQPAWPTCANPTPYDIFAIAKSAPYTKARFAELVKLYHPDKHHAGPLDALPSKDRLERYRLVVLANDILSSPDKRRAYDSWGAGWHAAGTGAEDTRDINEIYRQADKAWRQTAGNPGMNATWEDWERWHDRRNNGEKQQPLYMSNTSFAALVLAALAVGTVVQTARMDNSSAIIVERRQIHEMNVSDALRRQSAATSGQGKEERIERFIRERENLSYDFTPAKFDARPESHTK